jgi:tryptophan 2,3-dioxygenase
MTEPAIDSHLLDKLNKLQQKYDVMGQDLSSYLDGLLHADYLTYWDYIHVDTLLSLQNPKTQFPDEKIFIIYHQITELYFKLILLEVDQLANHNSLNSAFFATRIDRIIRYFEQLITSFSVMVDGMEKEQFLKFRMALLPASGFQSAQYRFIEICSTDVVNLVDQNYRHSIAEIYNLKDQLDKLYWRSGATELATGKKTLTLKQFEQKYSDQFLELAIEYKEKNLRKLYMRHFSTDKTIIEKLRKFDLLSNVMWPLAHLRSAGHYLQKSPEDIKATGGTNWQKYLPPKFRKVMFFPELWTDQEKLEWGKPAVDAMVTFK